MEEEALSNHSIVKHNSVDQQPIPLSQVMTNTSTSITGTKIPALPSSNLELLAEVGISTMNFTLGPSSNIPTIKEGDPGIHVSSISRTESHSESHSGSTQEPVLVQEQLNAFTDASVSQGVNLSSACITNDTPTVTTSSVPSTSEQENNVEVAMETDELKGYVIDPEIIKEQPMDVTMNPVSEENNTSESIQQNDLPQNNVMGNQPEATNMTSVGSNQSHSTTGLTSQTSTPTTITIHNKALTSTSKTSSTSSKTEPIELALDVQSLSQADIQLLSLLQSNMPQLSQIQENLKAILQNSLLIRSLKSTIPNSANPNSQTSKSDSGSKPTTIMFSQAPRNTATVTTPSCGSTTGVFSKTLQLVTSSGTPINIRKTIPTPLTQSVTITASSVTPSRKPVLAQIITPSKGPSGKTLSVSRTPQPIMLSNIGEQGVTQFQSQSPTSLKKGVNNSMSASSVSTLNGQPSTKRTPTKLQMPSILKKDSRNVMPSPLSVSLNLSDVNSNETQSTLVKPVDVEPMDIDVGEIPPSLELPPHLIDHSYCIYNPGTSVTPKPIADQLLSIPSERLSYAPEIPDSPRTLYKLLKILPKKASVMSTPRLKSHGRNYGTPSSRMSRKPPNFFRKRKTPFGKRSRNVDSGDESFGSGTPDISDNEDTPTRRRSQRNAGQRKRYIDDINLSLSDEETLDDIMQPPPKKTSYYSVLQLEDEESDYDENNLSSVWVKEKSTKHKKAITINPTEGFRYSDIYLDAPPEEANIVEKILLHRKRPTNSEEEKQKYGEEMEEFLVKYKNYSYLHTEWATAEKLLKGDKRFDGKAKRYKIKHESLGIFANIDNEPFNPDYTVADRVLDMATQTEASGEAVTHYLVKWKSLPYEDSTWELQEDVDTEVIRFFCQLMVAPPDEELQYVRRPPPNRFKPIKESSTYKGDNSLRPYQLEGLNWLLFNWYTRQNCILADEMGLGKTVQSIAFLLEVMDAGIRGPFLVIAPLSTISNWQREFETWSDINVVIYHGSAYSRRMIHEYELYYRDSTGKIIPDAYKFNVIVTTYEVMLSDNSELQNILWRVAIIDEAHRLKNKNCKMLEGLKELHMEHRVLLTGTPLQNSVDELFSLLNFLEPSQFPSLPPFLQQFGDLKTEEEVDELKGVLKPMMLRRLKEDVEKSLAPKEETIVEVELTAIQKQYYRAILEKNFSFLTKGTNVPNLLNTMMELRKCCNHPFLINGAEQKIVSEFQLRYPGRHTIEALIQASGKLVLVDKLLPKLKEGGHKVLIFSQMVRCLDILEDYLRVKGYFYERIDGQVRGTLRQAAIDRFSKPDSDRFVFLLCTRAGGLGINLTAADTVIIYDSDWNPQNDIQAQARCHRIGQNKMVKVYRLITHNSYEREMFDRASLKLGLDKAVLQSMNTQQQSGGPPQLSKIEIEGLLKKGAYGAIMDSDDAANQFCEEDIEQILERRTQVIQLESEGKGSSFSKASFVSDGSTDISIDDPDFWQKWAEKANLDLEQLAKKDTLVVDEPRVRRQVRRYGDDLLETIVDMDESQEEIMDILPARGRRGWTKLECFKTEKGLLIYGWGEFSAVLKSGKYKRRQLTTKDVENIARTMLVYCLHNFSGDERVKIYIHQLIDPSIITEESERGGTGDKRKAYFSGFTEDDYLALMAKEPDSLFQDESYMKHLRRHSTRILLRIRQLHVIRWQIMKPYMDKILIGTHVRNLGLTPPKPEEDPPAPWWDSMCDLSLLVAIVKHGYEQFRLWRSDPTLCFIDLVGEQPPQQRKNKKRKHGSKTPSKGEVESDGEGEEFEDDFDEGEESDDVGNSAPTTPQLPVIPIRKTRASATLLTAEPSTSLGVEPGFYTWPSLAEINTRARRLVNAYFKQQRKEEIRQHQLLKERERKEREAEAARRKEQKKAELAQKWSKREEQDFVRVVSFFGLEYENDSDKYDWRRFRQLANLGKKSDERLSLYLHEFKKMCRRVITKKPTKTGFLSVQVEVVNEERATKCLQRIQLLSVVRRELLPHPEFDKLIQLCESSFEVPSWWLPGQHDKDLLLGVAKHGLYRSDHLIYNDPELSFLESVPQSALFIPNSIAEENDEAGSESEGEEEGPKLRSSAPSNSTPVPLGWPKDKATVIRISRIVYAFRNQVWPKPMEGLDLFNPLSQAMEEPSPSPSPSPPPQSSPSWNLVYPSDDESSIVESDHDSDMDYMIDGETEKPSTANRRSNLTLRFGKGKESGQLTVTMDSQIDSTTSVKGGSLKDKVVSPEMSFQVEKQQGLKMTLKKGSGGVRSVNKQQSISTGASSNTGSQMNVKIPLVMLKFPSLKGLKRIPRKKPNEKQQDQVNEGMKKNKSPSNKVVDPTKLCANDLTGMERVSVINKNTGEKLPYAHSPMLKKLEGWLKAHSHYGIDAEWGPLVISWGAIGSAMYNRILPGTSSTSNTRSHEIPQYEPVSD